MCGGDNVKSWIAKCRYLGVGAATENLGITCVGTWGRQGGNGKSWNTTLKSWITRGSYLGPGVATRKLGLQKYACGCGSGNEKSWITRGKYMGVLAATGNFGLLKVCT